MISLPFIMILFVLTDGWYLVVGSEIKTFNGTDRVTIETVTEVGRQAIKHCMLVMLLPSLD